MSAVLADLRYPPPPWRRPALTLVAVLLAILALYFDTARLMVGVWSRSDTFAHAFLVPPISAWLVWRGRDRLASLAPKPAWGWALALAVGALGWMLGDMAAVNALAQFALVFMLVVSVPLVLGPAVARAALFPLLFLFFCVPTGEFLLPLLMELTADFTVSALRMSGIPVYREGLQFVIPSGAWSVVEACSGVRYLIASLMVGSLFAYLNYQSPRRRLIFVGVSIVVPIVANWLRAYMIVMLGHLSNNRIATGVDHLVYGWVFFGVVITIMFMIGARWSEPDRPLEQRTASGVASVPVAGWPAFAAVLPLVLVVLALPLVAKKIVSRQISSAPVQLSLPSAGEGGWALVDGKADLQPRFTGAAAQAQGVYQRQGRQVAVYVAYYRRQDAERKLISSSNVLVPSMDPVWNNTGSSQHQVSQGGDTVTWRQARLMARSNTSGGSSIPFTAWQSYWVDGQWVESDSAAKVRGIGGLLAGRGDDAAALVLHTEGDPAAASQVLTDFTAANLPSLRLALERARDSH